MKISIETYEEQARLGELSEKGLQKYIRLLKLDGKETLKDMRMRYLAEGYEPKKKPITPTNEKMEEKDE